MRDLETAGPAWPVGVEMLCYMLAHEARHRGQVLMLAHQLGFPLSYEVSDGILELGKAVERVRVVWRSRARF